MSTAISFLSSAPTAVDVVPASALPARLPARSEDHGSEPVETRPVDGALTLTLVEHAAASMTRLEKQLETISVCGLDLLRLTRAERQRFETELQEARHEAETWKQHAIAAEAGLRDATLRAWEADLYRRECEFALQKARQRADAADKRTREVEFYLRKIDTALRSRFSPIDEFGRPAGNRLGP